MRMSNRSNRSECCLIEIGQSLVVGKVGIGFIVVSPFSQERRVFDERDEAMRFAFQMQEDQTDSEVIDVRSLNGKSIREKQGGGMR